MRVKILIVGVLAFLLGVAGISYAQENNSIRLGSFGADILADSSFLEQEAGISAYGHASNVDISGWIVAYYLAEEKASKMIDWVEYAATGNISTKLEDALAKVAIEMYTLLSEINFYDFRYPYAQSIIIVTDETSSGTGPESFRVKIPVDHPVFSRTWSHAIVGTGGYFPNSNLKLDNALIDNIGCRGFCASEGELTPIQLLPDQFHEVVLEHSGSAWSYVGLVLIYSEPLP